MKINAFYSDPHFGHTNIIRPDYADRPFKDGHGNPDVAMMDEALVKNYNSVVSPYDIVLWLGDVFFGPVDSVVPLLARLHGRKLLVRGNHDKSDQTMISLGFELVMKECTTIIAGRRVRISHYPYEGHPEKVPRFVEKRPRRKKGEILLHGHTHSKKQIFENQIHVGVDAWDYRPVLYGEVEALIQKHFPTKQV